MAKDDATQPDAEEHEVEQGYKDESEQSQEEFKEEVDSEEEYLSPRQKAIEELVSKRNEDFEQETDVDFSSEEVEEVEEVVKEVAEDAPVPPVWRDGDSWYTTVKVDAEEITVRIDDLISSHQT